MTKRIFAAVLCCALTLCLCVPAVMAEELNTNLVYNNGNLDGILTDGETERTLNGDWGVSYPVATFGSASGDSPAIVRNVDGNAVLVLEHSSGNFASFFADLSADDTWVPAGTYVLSMDIKPVGTAFNTDNVGFNLYNQYTDVRIYDNGWQNCTEGTDGWLHYSKEFEIGENSVDSIQMWFNTMGLSPEECALYIDNISFVRTANVQKPEGEELNVEYTVKSGSAITVNLTEAAEKVTIAEAAGYTLEEGVDYTYANGVITLSNDYADGLGSGIAQLLIQADSKNYVLNLTIKAAKPTLPESTDGYLMQETLVGGDFEMFEENFAFSLEQVEGWGSNISYDDPGVIVVRDGNKVLRLQKNEKTSYSSAFAFISPTIQSGDVLTLGFDYLLDVSDPNAYLGADINFCFVSASNMQMCLIPLDNSKASMTRGDGDYQWEVSYTDKENGWVHVEMTFVANTALLSYNSMRFLLPTNMATEGDALYVDNVSLVLWAEPKAPIDMGTEDLVFDKSTPADVFAMINLQALDPQKILVDGVELTSADWSVNPSKDTITLSKTYLATLENGEHTVTVETAGGSCSVKLTVKGEAASNGGNNNDSNNTWIWVVAVVVVAVAATVAVILVKKGKKA